MKTKSAVIIAVAIVLLVGLFACYAIAYMPFGGTPATPLLTTTFLQSGLPQGSSWSITFNNVTKISSSNSITFKTINGSFKFNMYANEINVTPIKNISVGVSPMWMTYYQNLDELLVTNDGSNTLSVINTTTDAVVRTVKVGLFPAIPILDSTLGVIYVTNMHSDSVTVINASSFSVIKNLSTGSLPLGIALDPSNGYLYIGNSGSGTVSVIDSVTGANVTTINVGGAPRGVTYNPANGHIYVANYDENKVNVINPALNSFYNITVGTNPMWVTYDPYNQYIYVDDYGSSNLMYISNNSVLGTIPTGIDPVGVVYAGNHLIMEINYGSGTVGLINDTTNSVMVNLYVSLTPEKVIGNYTNQNGTFSFVTYKKNLPMWAIYNNNTGLLYMTYFRTNFVRTFNMSVLPDMYIGILSAGSSRQINFRKP